MEPGQHLCEKDSFRDKALDFEVPALQVVSHSVVLYSGFSMRARREMQWRFLLVPATTPKITWSSSLLHALWGRGETVEGRGRDWGVRKGESKLLLKSQQYPGKHSLDELKHWRPFSLDLANNGGGVCTLSLKSPLPWRPKALPDQGATWFSTPIYQPCSQHFGDRSQRTHWMTRSACFRQS